ncbi:MAG: DUF3883 domain-containing protein [Bacteroidales bacterium]
MITTELKHKIKKFDIQRRLDVEHFKKLEELQSSFVTDFPIGKIADLMIDEYIVGKGSNISFCNRLERQLEIIGRMRGSTSSKFVVYYGVNGKDETPMYRFTAKLGKVSNEHEALVRVKAEIISLINAGKIDDRKAISKNRLSDLFKYKILGTYFPNKYLNLYSQRHLNFFLGELGLNPKSNKILDKQDALFALKNNNAITQAWSNYEFNSFLYNEVGYPPSNDDEEKEKDALPAIENIKPELVDFEIQKARDKSSSKEKGTTKPNYKEKQEENNKLGRRGEIIAYNWEKQFFNQNKLDLSQLIHSSEKDDRLGYDIQSLDENGSVKYIEVKATRKQKGDANFIITANERKKAELLDNYHIYVVFEAHTLHPKIWQIKEPFKEHQKKINLTPINYRVSISVKE